MSAQTLGLLVGGLLPAICFGLSGAFAKSSTNAGISTSLYLLAIGVAIALSGGLLYLFENHSTINLKSGAYAGVSGVVWALGAGSVTYALMNFGIPISKLVPLYNTNTLIAVLLGLWLFSEWRDVNLVPLLLGAVLIVIGGVLVSNA